MRDVARQLRTDFGLLPDLVDKYVVHTPRDEALKASRQVCGVTHYLSLMRNGDADMRKCALFGVTITCIDEVTDELGKELHPRPIRKALDGEPTFEPLKILPVASDEADIAEFDASVMSIAQAQDFSMEQLTDIGFPIAQAVTKQKGGWSARANLAMIADDITDDEWEFMWQWGLLMQMLDDYLDRPKDERNGLTTPFTLGRWSSETVASQIRTIQDRARELWGESRALTRFFRVCRLHRRLGQIENHTPLKASWLAPGYL